MKLARGNAQSRNFTGFIPRGGGWEISFFLRAVNCVSRVSAKAFWGAFFSAKPVFVTQKTGVCGATPVFLRVPCGLNWRALELFSGGGMSKTGSSRVPNAGGTSKGGLVVRATYPRPRDWNGLRGNTAGKCLSFFKEQKKAACVSVFPNENGTTNGQTTCPTSSPTPAPHAAQDAPRTSREPGPHFRIRLYIRGSMTKNLPSPCPYSENAPAN